MRARPPYDTAAPVADETLCGNAPRPGNARSTAAAVRAGLVAIAGRAAGAAVQAVGLQVHAGARRAAGETGRADAGAGAAHLRGRRAGVVARAAVGLAGPRVGAIPVAVHLAGWAATDAVVAHPFQLPAGVEAGAAVGAVRGLVDAGAV